MLPDANIKINPHPAYNFFKIKNMSREDARKKMQLDNENKVLLFFGLVREYKGLKYLIKAIPIIKEKIPDIKLLIAGDFGDNKEEYINLINESCVNDVIKIYAGHIPIIDVEKFFAACDMVVLPYESATQSGVIQVAYGFEKPVLATCVGGLPDVVQNMKTGYLVEPKNELEISEAIVDYFKNKREKEFSTHIQESAYRFSWDRMQKCIESFFDENN